MSSLTTMLAEGELDIAFVRLPCESSKVFELKSSIGEPMVVALHRDHPGGVWRSGAGGAAGYAGGAVSRGRAGAV